MAESARCFHSICATDSRMVGEDPKRGLRKSFTVDKEESA